MLHSKQRFDLVLLIDIILQKVCNDVEFLRFMFM